MGKTLLARSLGRHLYFHGLFSASVATSDPDAEYAIFDDLQGGIKFFHSFKSWFGCQSEFAIKKLYHDPIMLLWGKPSIWLSNDDPRDDMSRADASWLEGNCDFIEVNDSLINESQW